MVAVAVLAFIVGAACGAALMAVLRRPAAGAAPTAPAQPVLPSAAAPPVPADPAPVAPAPAEPAASADGDPDLKPVLDATRGVVSALEERYQGARAAGDEEQPSRRARRPRRRA